MAKRRGRRRGRRRDPFKFSLKKETIYSVSSALMFMVAGLITVSFAQSGSLLIAINRWLLSYLGWTTVFLPFLFVSMGLMMTRLKVRLGRPNVILGTFLALLGLNGLWRSGTVGFYLFMTVAASISAIGSFIIFLGLMVIGLVILFETSLEEIAIFVQSLFKGASSLGTVVSRKKPLLATNDTAAPLKIRGIDNKPVDNKPDMTGKKPLAAEKKEMPLVLSPNPVPGQLNKIWQFPPLSLLSDETGGKADRGNVKKNADTIEKTLESFGISARVVEVNGGPAVTQYAMEIAIGTKLSKITALANDLALSLAAPTGQIRIEAPIPGRSLVGLEIPNHSLEYVTLKGLLSSSNLKKSTSKLSVGLGLDVSGKAVITDIAKMPHVLIAGATGSGKSVCINSFIACLLFRATPDEVKFIMVDPKRVELTQYNGIPHLLTPVIVEPEKVVSALKWAMVEMERRYKMFAESGVRNIEAYNQLAGFQSMPYIVIIIDELADIMLFAPSEVEDTITRIAQMARATGIHLIVATQRPSVDVITGLIKANIPCRIAFNVSSMIDSRVIIDMPGAEKLLGRGDMLYIPPNQSKPSRIQGAFVSDIEIQALITFLKKSGVGPQYTEEVTTKYKGQMKGGTVSVADGGSGEVDQLFESAVRLVCQHDKASASLLQRKLSVGYARAARILDQLHDAGLVSASEGAKPREVLIKNAEDFLAQRQAAE
jgi:S-DNA-T family DNA segregation ATPase FtsK/SpoIIIE